MKLSDKLIKSRFKFVLSCSILALTICGINSPIYAGTVDDVRELLGRERVDKRYSELEIMRITKKYMQAEKNNIVAKMFELGSTIEMDDYEADKIQLLSAIDNKKDELNKAFSTGVRTEEVLKIKTELDNLMHEVERLKEVGYEITVDFESNPYTEEYKSIMEMVNKLDEQYDIGDVGIDMKSPLMNSFLITSPFGTRLDPFTGETSIHNGLDLGASHREPVLSQWNGIVTQAFFSETGGNMVVIAHGSDLTTRYLHMDELNVKAGDIVNQYDVIGYAGSTGRSTGTHLHFEVKLDGIPVNPLMLYGNKGLNALKSWISINPNQLQDTEFMKNVKDRPDEVVFKVEEIYRGYDAFIAPSYKRGKDSKELEYKEKMELKEKGLISIKDIKLPLTEEDRDSLLNGGGIITQVDDKDDSADFNENSSNNSKYTENGELVEVTKLPDNYIPPNPGFPLLSEAHGEEEHNANINEADIEDFEEYGQMHVSGGLMKVEIDVGEEKDTENNESTEKISDDENREYHLGDEW